MLHDAVRSTLGSNPMQFFMNVLLPNTRGGGYKFDEVIYSMVAYFSGVVPDKSVQIYPGARGV